MKKRIVCVACMLGSLVQAKNLENSSSPFFNLADGKTDFDCVLFQKVLTRAMENAFPWMVEDTTNNYAARATSQSEAGSPACYASKQGGMVNTKNDEYAEANRIVDAYKDYLYNSPYFGETALKKYYVDFSAVATKQYGGLIRYGLIVDNNIVLGPRNKASKSLSSTTGRNEIAVVDSMVKARFGPNMVIDDGFEIGCVNYVKEKTENTKIPFASGQAHYHFFISSKDGLPRKETIEEIFTERFDYLDSLGLPLTISRYYITVIQESGVSYLILALDN